MMTDDLSIPTEADWRSEPWDLDTPHAYQHFAGKDLAQSRELFVENALYYQEDLQHMPAICFRYYVWAYIEYLLSEKSYGDSDGARCFFGLVSIRHNELRSEMQLREAACRVLQHLQYGQETYNADIAIYGDFEVRAELALRLLGC
jgi:hypothetical protein